MSSLSPSAPQTGTAVTPPTAVAGRGLERRGLAWLVGSFLLCPCHLPLTLAALSAVLASTSFGVLLRDHIWVAGTLITVGWAVGTGYGLRLIRQAERAGGTCPARTPKR